MGENTLSLFCDGCGTVYDSEAIADVAKFWGIIVYEGKEHIFIGLTCVECAKTIIEKFSLEDIQDWRKEITGVRRERIRAFDKILPFSYEILTQSEFEGLPQFVSEEKGERYQLPAGFKLAPTHLDKRMPGYFREITTYMWESDLSSLLAIENVHRLKVFPRLTWNKSIYNIYDQFLYETNEEFTLEAYRKCLGEIFWGRNFFYYCLTNGFPEHGDASFERKYNQLLIDTGTMQNRYSSFTWNHNAFRKLEEYEEIQSYIGFHKGGIPEQIDGKLERFRKDYLKIRNKSKFEMLYRDEFYYPNAKNLYHYPAWSEEMEDDVLSDLESEPEYYGVSSLEEPRDFWLNKPVEVYGVFTGVQNDQNIATTSPGGNGKKRTTSGKTTRTNAKNNEELAVVPKVIEIKSLETPEQRREYLDLLQEIEGLEAEYPSLKKIVALSKPMLELKKELVSISKKSADIFMYGERGTGKTLIAEAIHEISGRKGKFVVIDCNEFEGDDSNIARSELFGSKKGSFTGSTADTIGAFEKANGGTLFLDEIGIIPMKIQSLILKAVEDKAIRPLGRNIKKEVEVTIVYATNKDMVSEVKQGRFMKDLWDRVRRNPVTVPPLYERIPDIFLLTENFLGKPDKLPDVRAELLSFIKTQMVPPGNVRDLKNSIENWEPENPKHSLGAYFGGSIASACPQRVGLPGNNTKFFDEEVIYWWHQEKRRDGWQTLAAKKFGVAPETVSRRWKDLKTGIIV